MWVFTISIFVRNFDKNFEFMTAWVIVIVMIRVYLI